MIGKKRLLAIALVGAGLLSLLTTGADAQKKPREEAPAVDISAELATTGQLIDFARKYKVPEALVDAGGIYLKVARADVQETDEPTLELPLGEAKEEVKIKSLTDQAEDLFYEALGLTKDEKAIRLRIETVKAKAAGMRGVKGSPKRHQAALAKGATHTHKWRFKGGEHAHIVIQSTQAVKMQIVSTTGQVVGFSHGAGGQAMWHPGPKDAEYIIRVTSMSKTTTTTYTLVSN